MNKSLLRTLALMLATLMLLASLVACTGSSSDETPDDTDTGTSDNNTPSADTPSTDDGKDEQTELTKEQQAVNVLNALEQRDLSNTEFLVAASSSYENVFTIDQFPTDDDFNGSTVHDALFSRDQMIEEYFGVDIVWDDILDSQIPTKLGNTIRSGDDIYSLILGGLAGASLNLFNNSLGYDLNSIEHIDLSQPWWNQNSVEAFSLNNKIFMATGAITNRYVYAPYALLFNTRLLEAEGVENPYNLIADDNWTFEIFQNIIIGTAREEDGNDIMDEKDFYGLAPADDSQTAWFFACGGRLVEASPAGEFRTVYEEESNYELLAEVLEFCTSDDVLKYKTTYDSNNAFKESRAIFHVTALCDITMLADMEDKYGIVPLPKYDENQENYYSNTNKYINTMAIIPVSVVDTDTVGLVTEALAAVSQYTSLDKQYEVVLLNRQALDAESKANLQLVVESSCYDWGYLLNPEKLADTIKEAMKGKNGMTEFGSFFASIREPVQAALDQRSELFKD